MHLFVHMGCGQSSIWKKSNRKLSLMKKSKVSQSPDIPPNAVRRISVEECRNMSAKGRQRRSSDPYFARRKSINDPILDRNEEFTPENDGLTFVETNRLRMMFNGRSNNGLNKPRRTFSVQPNLTSSQIDFFRMIDEKIAKGKEGGNYIER